jgi:hypothetical protein
MAAQQSCEIKPVFVVVEQYKEGYAPGNWSVDTYWQNRGESVIFTSFLEAERKKTEMEVEWKRKRDEKKREFEEEIASGELGAYALTWLDRDDRVRVIIKRIEIGNGFTLTDEIPRRDYDVDGWHEDEGLKAV